MYNSSDRTFAEHHIKMKSGWVGLCLPLMFSSTVLGDYNMNVHGSSVRIDNDLIMKMQQRLEYLEERDQAYRKEMEERDQAYRREIDALRLKTKTQQDQIDQLLATEKAILAVTEKNTEKIDNLSRRVEHQNERIASLPERQQHLGEPDVTTSADEIQNGTFAETPTEKKSQRLRRAPNEITVGFTATLSKNLVNVGTNQDIAFDHVITNVGNAYNPHHGIFVAPVSVIYAFSFTIAAYRDENYFNLVVNGQKVIASAWSIRRATDSEYNASGQTVVLQLNANDDVAIQNQDANKNINSHSVFSGFLLQQSYSSTGAIVGKY